MRPSAWVLNLDADRELAARGSYAPKESVRAKLKAHRERLAASIFGPEDIEIDETTAPNAARGYVGRAFSPTKSALALLERAGATIAPHPSLDVLRRVTSRAFSAALGPTLPGQAFVRELGEAMTKLGSEPPVGNGWRLKRAFGMAGREHRVVDRGAASRADEGFMRAAIDEDGIMIEPNVAIVAEYGIHGFIDGASFALGALVEQRTDAHGAWIATERSEADVDLKSEAERVAKALIAAGYVGPFGIDAFTWRDPSGAIVLDARSEVNARYTMGFGIGFGRPP